MKKTFIAMSLALLLSLSLLSGCSAVRTIDAAEDRPENRIEYHEDRIENSIEHKIEQSIPAPQTKLPISPSPNLITEVEATEIALAHAGLTAEQVQYMHTEFEIDDRIPEYTVAFYANGLEYEYEIHGESGAILSFEADR